MKESTLIQMKKRIDDLEKVAVSLWTRVQGLENKLNGDEEASTESEVPSAG